LNKSESLICRALLKYGYSSFQLEILKECEREQCLKYEQEYIDLFNPEYNILPVAGSSLGHSHSEETKAKMREAARKV
jgi:group I intron endonuclease